jgi:hypothetical protein
MAGEEHKLKDERCFVPGASPRNHQGDNTISGWGLRDAALTKGYPGPIVCMTVISTAMRNNRSTLPSFGMPWHFRTSGPACPRLLFKEAFPVENVRVDSFGNVLEATAFLHSPAAEELRPTELEYRDPDYELLITIKAAKSKHGDVETAG